MFDLNFGVKSNFSKVRIEHIMLKVLATTEKAEKEDKKNQTTIAGRGKKK